MKKWKLLFPLLAVVLVALFGGSYLSVKAKTDTDTIADGVYIGSVNVGGMTKQEAAKAVTEVIDQTVATEYTLAAEEKQITVTGGDLGLYWANEEVCQEAYDVGRNGNLIVRYKDLKDLEHEDKVLPIQYSVDEILVQKLLKKNLAKLNVRAVNNSLTRENGEFVFVEGKSGVKLDMAQSLEAVKEFFSDTWKETEIALVCTIAEPEGTKEELSKVKDVLGDYTTDYSSSTSGRAANVTNGASKINGTVIYPGEQFSVYQMVSPFDAENGYELAGSYENGTTVQSYGGGICQVSTTLYNAVLEAELQVDERFCHSMIVGYVQPSMDAAIAGTYKDLKFTNNTDAPIYIEGHTAGGQISFTVYGEETRSADRKVTYESETTETTDPTEEFVADSTVSIGSIVQTQSSHTGYKARLWKIVTVNGVEQSREVINNSTYKASPTIYSVGTKTSVAAAKSAMKTAIATNDLTKIKEAISLWNDEAIKDRLEQQEQDKQDQTDQDDEDSQDDKNQNNQGNKNQNNSGNQNSGTQDGNSNKGGN